MEGAGAFVAAGPGVLVDVAGRCMPPGGGGPRLEGAGLSEREGGISNVGYTRLCCEIAWKSPEDSLLAFSKRDVYCIWRGS